MWLNCTFFFSGGRSKLLLIKFIGLCSDRIDINILVGPGGESCFFVAVAEA